jgi:outer membrane receptor for Fe3+-dicitrate
VSVTGNRLPYAPEHLLTAGAGYTHPSGLDVFVEAVHTSLQFGDDLNTVVPTPDGQRGPLPAYTVWNLTVNHEIGRASLYVTVKNLFDDVYIVDRIARHPAGHAAARAHRRARQVLTAGGRRPCPRTSGRRLKN